MENLTAASVPAEFRTAANLDDWIAFRALQTDPRFSYCLYIPHSHYTPSPTTASALPLIINIHGTGRRAEQCCLSLSAFADTNRCAVLAPLFPTCIGSRFELDNYKTLRYGTIRFDLLLLEMIEEVRSIWGPGIATEQFFLMGFSGGGQFVHRFLYLHPERLLGVSIGAPGRPTDFLDHSSPWPQGVADVESVFDRQSINLDLVKQVKAVHLIIGRNDTEVPGQELFQWLAAKRASSIDPGVTESAKLRAPSLGRMEAISKVGVQLEEVGLRPQMDIVEGAAHDHQAMLPAVCSFLKPLVQKWHEDYKV